ncbi:phenylalanine--tRNA ligase subunit beta [Salinibacterium hongtaonis]|uniref:Phenylalanine--tRNA ligase beta subunit n=1 Tax=Homoserinimonas hongtaonis TaxID=2079791 RepID=A0A2U1SXH2_9MICO|nr:phenylalanine--tRNA ligase subunit beta [Salinibacterium hongtaonis]PWB96330.1 phenylalanine--tRNA ligase subunit beta [Salinibacterium hongtaonis]
MRVPISWLREFVDVPEDATAESIQAALVRVGLEEEDIHRAELTGPIVVGTVLEFADEPQSNGKTIRWCQLDVGEDEPRGVVCGASNFFVGDKVVVSLPGAVLPGPFPIAARKTYGHVSDGMIASSRELGLGDDHEGILRLSELGLDPDNGTDAIALLGLDDYAVEVNVTPDRGYAFSIRGIAREFSNSTGASFHDPALVSALGEIVSEPHSGFSVVINDEAPIRGRVGASTFVTRVVRGIDPSRPTPTWMASRLRLAGVRSVSLAVDITNYVMFELGQPIHGYDLDRLSGGLTVRRAYAGETLLTLDDQTRSLNAEDLVIADESGAIGLAGVMGGAATEISDATTNVLIEAANFDPVSIARTARRHKLPSEASKRFERGVDPLVAEAAAARVAQLLVELAGGTLDELGSSLVNPTPAETISLRAGFVGSLMGVEYTEAEIRDSLIAIGATVGDGPDGSLEVTPPSWRPDLTDEPTLTEEVARLVGYDRIPSVLPVAPPGRGLSREQRLRRSAAQVLAANGVTEIQAYPFVSAATHARFSGDAPAMRLANSLDAEVPLLRRSLLPGLIEATRRNLSRGLTDLALFEVGTVFLPERDKRYGSGPLPAGNVHPGTTRLVELDGSIPPQPWHVGALFVGNRSEKQPGTAAVAVSLVDALDAARQLAAAVGTRFRFEQGSHPAYHPGRTAEIYLGDTVVGIAGELLPALADELDLPRVVAVLELDLSAVIDQSSPDVATHAISSFPAATQDVSLVVPIEIPAASVLAAIEEGAGSLLEHAYLVDDYRGAGIEGGSKSLTFALRFRGADRTLTAAEASESRLAGVAVATERFGATLRE